ncbi:MAG: glutamate 5-kinase [Verrucomicrobiota bacterium]|nr:glutamate 5-kinase [Verrucomicrobiota bacterium]
MVSTMLHARRAVLKLGTGLLTSGKAELDIPRLNRICEQVAILRRKGIEVIIVSSGAVGLGMGRLGIAKRPTEPADLQACAAIGQAMLMELWRKGFDAQDCTVAQILLTHEDVRARHRHLAVRNTLERLLALNVIPIINENDTVSVEEVKFGDNDLLSALTASLSKADILVILSTIIGLLDMENGKRLVPVVEVITPEIEALAGGTTSATAVGGMKSKIVAAKVATRSGCGVFIGSGHNPDILVDLFEGRAIGTFFSPARIALHAKKRWLAFFQQAQGSITVDAGAHTALTQKGGSLLARGITGTTGQFKEGAVVNLSSPEGAVFARGVSRFSAADLAAVLGKSSDELKQLYPTRKHLEVIHRDSLVMLG